MIAKYMLAASFIGFSCISCEGIDMNVKKVVIPAAGLGTRFYPWSKSVPKELVPLGNRAAIECVVQEAITAGCSDIVMIAGARKHSIIDYFEKANLPATFTYIPQLEQKGLGHAVAMAEPVIKDEYFGVMLPDDLFFSEKPGIGQLIDIAKREKATVIAVIEVPWEKVSAYGVISIKKQIDSKLFEISGLVEKPKREDAPSNLILPGRYVLSSKIFDSFKTIGVSPRGEIELTDAITDLVRRGERVLAYKIEGTRRDVGTPLGWMQAVVATALEDPKYGLQMRVFMESILKQLPSKSAREKHELCINR